MQTNLWGGERDADFKKEAINDKMEMETVVMAHYLHELKLKLHS